MSQILALPRRSDPLVVATVWGWAVIFGRAVPLFCEVFYPIFQSHERLHMLSV
jgi:hypothetical protein